MIYSIDCTARVNAQDPDYPTYKKIDCAAHCNANENWHGKIIDCIGYSDEFATTNVDTENDEITVDVDIPTGKEIKFITTDTLPTPLVVEMVYYAIKIDATRIKVATTLANANAGIAIDLSDVGVGTHTVIVLISITTILVTACKSWAQGIRLKVVIDDVDVSEAIIGSLNIQHDKNKISTFALNLGDTQYSPRTNGHIDLDKPIVITVYINRQEQKLFTGSIDEPEAENTPAFRVIVPGRDYGKKLLDKKMTLISVQDLAVSTKRSDVIKYIAGRAGVISVNIPEMNPITIDNSFQDQSLWDMIQKEVMVEQYWVKFDEDGNMQLKLDEIKSDPVLYPTPDWSYDEDRFIRLGYKKSRVGINKITVLGKTTQLRIPQTETKMTTPGVSYDTPVVLFSDSLSFADGEFIDYDANNNYTKTVGEFTLKIHSYGSGGYGGNIGIYVGNNSREVVNSYIITSKTGTIGGDAFLRRTTDSMSVGGTIRLKGMSWTISRGQGSLGGYPSNFKKGSEGGAFTFNITVNGYLNRESVPAIYEDITTYEVRYDQISAQITDPSSIAKYGERDGGSVEYPMLETVEQCVAVGKKIIRNNHKLGISNFEIPFNPLLKTGQTVTLSDRKIGLTERYLVEGVGHGIDIDDEGKIKARTQVKGICYA